MKKTAAIIFRSAILLLAGIGIGLFISDPGSAAHEFGMAEPDNDKVSRILQLIRHNYVDSVNTDSIEEGTINKVLQGLDPHSLYLPPKQARSINERLDGGFNGIGIEFQLLRDTMVVTQVVNGGPAEIAGVHNGDKIVRINDETFTGKQLTTERVDREMHGAGGSILKAAVIRTGVKGRLNFNIKRGYVYLSSLDASYMANDITGYIKISKFASTTDSDFRKALTHLKAEGMKKLVLDLRGNGGGYLNAATALADEFLPKGKLIVYTKGVHEPRTDYFATDTGMFQNGKMAVLIDEYSASASEIVSGALQDLDRAVIVGRRSFGKGLVQQQFPFADGSVVNLTVARYYTPSGRSIQKSYSNGVDSYRNELATRMQKGELYSAQNNLNDSIFKNSKTYHTASGKRVYSGGGIMPDIFVPQDTAIYALLLAELGSHQLFSAFVIDHMQGLLKKYDTADNFIKHYDVSDADVQNFLLYASKTLQEMDSREIEHCKPYIKTYIKADAARFKWGNDAYFYVINQHDPAFRKAVEAVME